MRKNTMLTAYRYLYTLRCLMMKLTMLSNRLSIALGDDHQPARVSGALPEDQYHVIKTLDKILS